MKEREKPKLNPGLVDGIPSLRDNTRDKEESGGVGTISVFVGLDLLSGPLGVELRTRVCGLICHSSVCGWQLRPKTWTTLSQGRLKVDSNGKHGGPEREPDV